MEYYGVTQLTGTSIFGERVPMAFATLDDAKTYAMMMGKTYRAFSTNKP